MSKTGTDITFIERLGPKVAIGADDYQWIVLKEEGTARPNRPSFEGRRWEAVGFIASSKQALIDCIAAKGLKLSAAGRAAIERQDAKIWRWRRN